MEKRRVTAIPATRKQYTAAPLDSVRKRRVAGYARVSTDHEDQVTSYAAQVDYYTNYIKGRDDWEFVSIYTEAGVIIGLNTARPLRHIGLRCFGSILQLLGGDTDLYIGQAGKG